MIILTFWSSDGTVRVQAERLHEHVRLISLWRIWPEDEIELEYSFAQGFAGLIFSAEAWEKHKHTFEFDQKLVPFKSPSKIERRERWWAAWFRYRREVFLTLKIAALSLSAGGAIFFALRVFWG